MPAFEPGGAATDKRPRPDPNSSTTSDPQFVVTSMSESTMPCQPAGTALLTGRRGLLWLIDLESKLHRDVRRERLYAPAPRGAPHTGSTRHLADPGRQRFDQPPRSVAELAVLVEVHP